MTFNDDEQLDERHRQLVDDFAWLVTKTWIEDYHRRLHLEHPWEACGQYLLGIEYQYGSVLCPSNRADLD